MGKHRMDTRKIGKAGEYRVISELLLRGWNPMLASIDDGVDIILDNNKTIQVKTVSTNLFGERKNSACITIATTRYNKGLRVHSELEQNRN